MKVGATDAIQLALSGFSMDNIRELSNLDIPDVTVSNIKDLAKQGRKYDEIKELISLTSQEPPAQEPGNNDPKPGNNGGPQEPPVEPVDDIDYKKLYEESLVKLQEAQQDNTTATITPVKTGPTEQELLDSWARSLM